MVPKNAPSPDLRIVQISMVLAHEEHDSQRSAPLAERLNGEKLFINPPIVAPLGSTQFVILDGANRCYAFSQLQYPHILVQVVSYDSGYVELDTWRHVISGWNIDQFLQELQALSHIEIHEGQSTQAIAHILLPHGRVLALCAPVENTHEQNAALRHVVGIYQRSAKLYRTAIAEPEDIWQLYPDAMALVVFPRYKPADIIAAAKYRAYLPPGVSRHIVHGRALKINYPLDALRDKDTPLIDKNRALQKWIQEKFANREIRYYSETTYQFDE